MGSKEGVMDTLWRQKALVCALGSTTECTVYWSVEVTMVDSSPTGCWFDSR